MEDIIAKYKMFVSELDGFWDVVKSTENWDFFYRRMAFWLERVAKSIEEDFSQKYANDFKDSGKAQFARTGHNDEKVFGGMYRGFRDYLSVLEEEIVQTQGQMVSTENKTEKPHLQEQKNNTIFIVHGHDEASANALEKLLRDGFGLESVILKDKPGKGRPLINKLEEESNSCGYAFVFYTPDDTVHKETESYTQARPNVLFELGYFFGILGRKNVCIIFKKGTKIPSDLEGISRVEFIDQVKNSFYEIQNELKAAGIIKMKKDRP